MLACSLSRVYTFGPIFRAESSHTVRHLNEFWMVEPEMAHVKLEGAIEMAEKFVKFVVNTLIKECEEDLRYFQGRFNPSLLATLESTCSTPFVRITYSSAISLLQSACLSRLVSFEFLPTWESGLQSEHERYLAEVYFQKPVFITHYPRKQKPFYMRQEDDPTGIVKAAQEAEAQTAREAEAASGASSANSAAAAASSPTAATAATDRETVRCFDLIIPGVGELIGGSEREERYEQLRSVTCFSQARNSCTRNPG